MQDTKVTSIEGFETLKDLNTINMTNLNIPIEQSVAVYMALNKATGIQLLGVDMEQIREMAAALEAEAGDADATAPPAP